MSCKPRSYESIPLRDVRQQGCQLRANELASYQVESLRDGELT